MALIEIDGLPINSMVIFHGELLVITRGYLNPFGMLSAPNADAEVES